MEILAERYGKRKGLYGIQILNEPITEKMWDLFDIQNRYKPVDEEMAKGNGPIPLKFLRIFYIDAYRVMRKHMPEDKAVVFHDGFDLKSWKDFMREEEFKNVVLDTHQYSMVIDDSLLFYVAKIIFVWLLIYKINFYWYVLIKEFIYRKEDIPWKKINL